MQIIVEPEATFAQRHASTPEDSFAFTQTDPHIFKQLRAGPLHAMTLLNLVARQMPARCKRVRVAVKREIPTSILPAWTS